MCGGGFSHLPTNWLLARRYMDDDQDHGHVVNYSKWLSCLHYLPESDSHTKKHKFPLQLILCNFIQYELGKQFTFHRKNKVKHAH